MKTKPNRFKLAPLSAGILLALSPLAAQAITYNSDPLKFFYHGGELWGPNSDYTFSRQAFIGSSFGATKMPTIGDISGGFGAKISTTFLPGRVGLDITGNISPGQVNIDYGANASLALPDQITAGNFYSFTGSSTVNHSSMHTEFSSLSVSEDLIINIPSMTAVEGCAFGKCGTEPMNTNIVMDPFDLLSYNRDGNGNVILHGITQSVNFGTPYDINVGYKIAEGLEVSVTVGTVTAFTPVLNTSTDQLEQGNLYSNGTGEILKTTVKTGPFADLVLGLPPPNLNLDVGVATISGTLYDLDISAIFNLAQNFTFDPNLMVSLAFDHPVTARGIIDLPWFNNKDTTVTSDTFQLSMNGLANLQFQFDKDTTVTPTFILGNNFTNHTAIDVDGSLDFGVLKGSVDVMGYEVASFPGFDWNLAQGNLGSIDIFNETYSLDFQQFVGHAFQVNVEGQVDDHISIWNGADASSNVWSKAGNWQDNAAPHNGDALVFDSNASGNNTAVNDNLQTVNGITFLHGLTDFLLRGKAITNTGSILNQSDITQSIQLDISAGSSQIWDGGLQGLKMTGQIDLAGNDLTLANVNVQNNQNFLVGSGDSEALNIGAGSTVAVDRLTIGQGDHGYGKVYVDGAKTSVQVAKDLTVGNAGAGNLFVENGGHISGANTTLGIQQGASAYIEVAGAGSKLGAQQMMTVGQDGLLQLKLSQGGNLASRDARVAIKATADVTLSIQDAASQWTVGHSLDMTGAGRTKLDISNGGALVVGSSSQVGQFQVGGGSTSNRTEIGVTTGGSINVIGDMQINQNANIHLTGAANTTPLHVSGSTHLNNGAELVLSNAATVFGKGLTVGGTLSSTGKSEVNGPVTLSQSTGKIETKTGTLAFTDAVTFDGGTFKTDAGATTQFLGTLHGTGNFSGGGNIDVEGYYSPGNSPATIQFGGENLLFGYGSTLTLDVSGSTPGSQYDQLLNIGNLDFQGDLVLDFGTFVPEAIALFNLFDFTSFSGQFNQQHIFVKGFDASRLDFSQLAVNGSLAVKAVPLPPALMMMASALVAFSAANRKRRQQAV